MKFAESLSTPREKLQHSLQETLPNQYGETKFYGLNVIEVPNPHQHGKDTFAVVWDSKHLSLKRRMKTNFDIWGDTVLRRMDYHVPHQPLRIAQRVQLLQALRQHPLQALQMLLAEPLYQRGSASEAWVRILLQGLAECYSAYQEGGETKGILLNDPRLFSERATLWDVVVSGQLATVDRVEAYQHVAAYIRQLQEKDSHVMNVNPWDMLMEIKDDTAINPLLSIPDISANRQKLTERAAKGYALLSFLFNIVQIEMEKVAGEDVEQISETLQSVLTTYGDAEVIEVARSFNRRMRFSLPGTPSLKLQWQVAEKLQKLDQKIHAGIMAIASQHVIASFRIQAEQSKYVRQIVEQETTKYLKFG